MKNEETYNAWKEHKRQIDLREDFADDVMHRIYRFEHNKRKPLFDGQRLIELISAHRFAKAAVVTAGAVAGFIRISFVVYAFLAC